MVQGPIGIRDQSPEDVAGKFLNFAANTAGTQVKTGAGFLLGLNVNTAGTGGANVFTLYDGTSTAGPIIGVFPTTPVSVVDVNPVAFTTGLFAVLTGTTTSGNITVIYS
jgi:hypothetical protein